MAYGDLKDSVRRTTSDKIFRNEAFNITKNPKHDGCVSNHSSKVYKFFDKKNFGSGNRNQNISNKKLLKNYANQLLENLRIENYTCLL